MIEFLKEIQKKNCDAILFLPGENDQVIIEVSNYREFGEKLDSSKFGLGDTYHILIFKEDEEGFVYGLDLFEGILGSPYEYISNMIKMDWYGVVCKKTTTSCTFIENMFDNLQKI